jgi:hypothetical protein
VKHRQRIRRFGGDFPRHRKWLGDNGAPELNHPLDDFIGRFQNQQLLPGCQADNRIWRRLNMFNKVRVQYERNMVYACQMDHFACPSFLLSGF